HLGNVFMIGSTSSVNHIATAGAHSTVSSGRYQPFLMKFNTLGQRLWGTYLYTSYSGFLAYTSRIKGIAVDQQNHVYVAATTFETTGIGTPESYMPGTTDTGNFDAGGDGFLMKFDPDGHKVWGSYYGGEDVDELTGLCVGNDNYLYGLGYTRSFTGIASPGAAITVKPSAIGLTSGFLFKFDTEGKRVWGTYLPGNKDFNTYSIVPQGNTIVISGATGSSTGIGTAGTHQPELVGGPFAANLVLMRYDTSGHKLWGSYYGAGNEGELYLGNHLTTDGLGNLYMTGSTASAESIRQGCTYAATYHDGFMSKWNGSGALLWGSYYDAPLCAVAAVPFTSTFFVTGYSSHDGLATVGSHQVTKPTAKPAGVFAKFRGDFTCAEIDEHVLLQGTTLQLAGSYNNYQWYFNGNPISGAGNAQFNAADTGYYYVTFSQCDCNYSSDTFHFTGALGIHDPRSGSDDFTLYPNPGRDLFTIAGFAANQSQNYMLTDLSGRAVKNGTIRFNAAREARLNISGLDSGVYILHLSGISGKGLKLVKSD
ncbi:MAG: T9SS type A sorting domain-containing protein, partial [Sphingobacteriales bacterium]